MKTNNFMEVVKKYNSKKYIENLKQNELVIYSPTSIEKNNIYNNQCLMVNWHDITKNIDNYSSLIKAIFSKYDIPVYIDEKKDLSQNILIKYTYE